MLVLNGKNLGERQKQLNDRVNEAALNNVNFDQVRNETDQSDVNKLFLIDLASKYKNIEYIIEILKSGDSLHISRALKCDWIFNDEFSLIINVDNLHHNVFPFMSQRMKKKLLTTISMKVRNEDRAIAFCNYCIDMKFTNIALNFVIFTSDAYKTEFLQKNPNIITELRYKNNFKHFVGDSYTITETCLATLHNKLCKLEILKELSHLLHSKSDIKYLDMLENHVDSCNSPDIIQLGKRASKHIITKHKDRVLRKPLLYINILNKSCVAKHSTPENARLYLIALLPQQVGSFWNMNFCDTYEYILNVLPFEERFVFLKKIFNYQYPEEPFEITLNFYSFKYYRFMTTEQKEKWALDHVASEKEILGIGNDFKWYKFINFEKSFAAIKKLIIITADSEKRNTLINVLIKAAKTQRDLEKLFKYYYERHNNEVESIKESFVNTVANIHNIFEFDQNCWDAFNKIYQNLDVYSVLNIDKSRHHFKMISIIYHVINNMQVHEALLMYLNNDRYIIYILKSQTDKLPKEKQETVYQYFFNFYMGKINEYKSVPFNDKVKYELRKYIQCIMDLLYNYDRTEQDIPDIVMKFMKLDWVQFREHSLHYHKEKNTTQEDIIRFLKQDAKLALENLEVIKKYIEDKHVAHLDRFLKKMKVYFANDISKEYLKFYNEMLNTSELTWRIARAATFGIFQLGEYSSKIDFMLKYAPSQSKVNRSEIDERLLYIQEAICATAFYSRPPVPLENMLMYVKGDYVKTCLPMFNFYSTNLPLPLCMEFIEKLLKNPVSIQKHGLRLAFTYFNAVNLRNLIFLIWRKTKNTSLRFIIYKNLYDKVADRPKRQVMRRNIRRRRYKRSYFRSNRSNSRNIPVINPIVSLGNDQNAQSVLFETLTILTLELHQEDDENIFPLLTSGDLPVHFISDFIAAVWKTVSALPINKLNIERMVNVIKYMCCNIKLIDQEMIRSIVDKIVRDELNTDEFIEAFVPTTLNKNKWVLTAYYIMYVPERKDLDHKLELMKLILDRCLTKLHTVHENTYIIREFFIDFIRMLLNQSFSQEIKSYASLNEIFETILNVLQDPLVVQQMYTMLWAIELNLVTRRALVESNSKCSSIENEIAKRTDLRNDLVNFGRSIGNLIMTYKEKNMYLSSFLDNIRNELINNTCTMSLLMGKFEKSINSNDVLVVASVALMEFKNREIYLLVLEILPQQYIGQYEEVYISVLNELKSLTSTDFEITCKIYEKFVNSNFVYRPYLLL